MNIQNLIDDIHNGTLDNELEGIMRHIHMRREQITPPLDHPDDAIPYGFGDPRDKTHFRVGMKVRFNQRTNPIYLRGTIATITKVNPVKVQVRLDIPMGRFGESVINVPTNIIEAI
jgi:hypothetical protein